MQYSVTAIVVSYNRAQLLGECLDGILGQTRRPDRIIIVDNASTDGARQVARDFADHSPIRTEVVALPRNVGGAGGFCAGIAVAAGKGRHDYRPTPGVVEYLWLMDDDTVPTPNALAALLDASDLCIETNGCMPTVLGSKAVWVDGREHRMNRPRPRAALAKGARRMRGGAFQVRSLSFVSCLINVGAVRGLHRLPISAFFLWNDDFEYTSALLRNGVGYYVPTSEVVHKTKKFGSSDADPGARFYNEVRNKIWMFRFCGGDFTPAGRLTLLLKTARRWAFTWLRAGDRAQITQCLRDGWRDGWATRPESNLAIFADAYPPIATYIGWIED
ncbi:glycosyltransferase [Bifidobacterium choerinum]|nr:glycosyltransferase [Bifidobacterium choerinum]